MAVNWTEAAQRDRDRIYDHIENDDPLAAIRMDERVVAAAERLASFPQLGRIGRVSGTRELVVHRNYVLVYLLDDAGPNILRVRHVAQRWPN